QSRRAICFELFARAFERVVDHLGSESEKRQRLQSGLGGLGPRLVVRSALALSRASPAGGGEEPAGLRCRQFPGRGTGMLRGGNTLENLTRNRVTRHIDEGT